MSSRRQGRRRGPLSLPALGCALVVLSTLPGIAQPPRSPAPRTVLCDQGPGLQATLDNLARVSPLEIAFQGTCREDLTIERPDLTLRGAGPDAVLEGSLHATRSQGLVLEGFSISNGGIEIVDSVGVRLSGLTVLDGPGDGVRLVRSTGQGANLTVTDSALSGIFLEASSLDFTGTLDLTGNGTSGLDVNQVSSARLLDTAVSAEGNSSGLVVAGGSNLSMVGGTLAARGNRIAGIAAVNQGVVQYSGQLSMEDNGVVGLLASEHSSWLPNGRGGGVTVSGNGFAGVITQEDSSLVLLALVAPIEIADNPNFGLLVDGSKALLIGVRVADNGNFNARFLFGSRLTLNATEVALPIDCADSILVRGPDPCPSAAASVAGEARSLDASPLPATVATQLSTLGHRVED